MGQPNLRLVQPGQTASVWPDTPDVADLLAIVEAQTVTIKDQAVLIDRYQGILNTAQTSTKPAVAIGTGTASGTPATTLAVSAVTNTIVVGATIVGAGVPTSPPTTIVSQQTGTTGGAGNYTTNQATTASAAVLTFTPPAPPPAWPVPQDSTTLNLLTQEQTAVIRTQTALIQHYQDVLNTSQTPAS